LQFNGLALKVVSDPIKKQFPVFNFSFSGIISKRPPIPNMMQLAGRQTSESVGRSPFIEQITACFFI